MYVQGLKLEFDSAGVPIFFGLMKLYGDCVKVDLTECEWDF